MGTEYISGHEVIPFPLEYGSAHQVPDLIIVHAMAWQIDVDNSVANYYKADKYPRVHQMVGQRLYAHQWLDVIRNSAHILVPPTGEVIRCRNDDQGAYHAKNFNTNSLGIEILTPDVYDYGTFLQRIAEPWVNDRQFQTTIDVIAHWCKTWSINDIRRHSDVSPGRKHDPGNGFPWRVLLGEVQVELSK